MAELNIELIRALNVRITAYFFSIATITFYIREDLLRKPEFIKAIHLLELIAHNS